MNRAVAVKNFLSQRYFIAVPDEWLTACIDYVVDENPDPTQDLNQNVYEQWLHSDLTQLEHPSLPREILTQESYMLTGKYCVQVNSVADVAQPAYVQLQKLKGRELDEADEPSMEWKKKKEAPRRMLKMELTDGVMTISAMEFQPIPALDLDSMKPGCKLQLRGQIMCKRGTGMARNASAILMLRADNVTVLGGSVDELVEQNNVANVLERQLKAAQQPNGPSNRTANIIKAEQPANRKQEKKVEPRPVPSTANTANTSVQQNRPPIKPAMQAKQPTTARVAPFTPEKSAIISQRRAYNNNDMDDADFVGSSARTTTTVSAPISSGYNRANQSTAPYRSTVNSTYSSNNLTGTTVAASIRATNQVTQRMEVDEEPFDQRNADAFDDFEDDEHILRAVANVEEEEQEHQASFALDFDQFTFGHGFDDGVEPPAEIDYNRPYSYLSDFLNDSSLSEVVIKGFVLSTAGKLEFSSTNKLVLKVRIADSSAKVECSISQEMLATLLGFPPSDARRLHSQATTNKDMAAGKQLSEGVSRCKHKLASLSGLLTIERCQQVSQSATSNAQYELVRFADPNVEDCRHLLKRIDAKLQRR